MTRDEAVAALKRCTGCKRWITVPSCDHCLMDHHRCPPTTSEALASLRRAVKIGQEARELAQQLGISLDR